MADIFSFLRGDRPALVRPVATSHPEMDAFSPLVEEAARVEMREAEAIARRGGLEAVTPCHLRGHAGWRRAAVERWFSRGADARRLGAWGATGGWARLPPTDGGRDLLRLPGGDVLKVALHEFGRASNLAEAGRWSAADPRVAPWLAPVVAAAPDGSWLVMRATEPAGAAAPRPASLPPELTGAVGDLGFPGHWGFLGDRPVLVEYAAAPCAPA